MIRRPSAYSIAVLILAAISLVPVWAFAFLPMQDLPQHLFQALALATRNTPEPWSAYYEASWRPGPYLSFYLVVVTLARWLGVQTAARVYVSLSVLGMAAYALFEGRSRQHPPWTLLLLFPLIFTQTYYLGFANFVVALPLLLFALRVHAIHASRQAFSLRWWAAHVASVGAVFLTHPYVLMVYLAIVAVRTAALARRRPAPWKAAVPAFAYGLVFAVWQMTAPSPGSLPQAPATLIAWWPPVKTLGFLALPVVSMGIPGVFGLVSLAIWIVALGILARGWWLARKMDVFDRVEVLSLLAVVAGFAILPFWLGYFSYFNARLAPVAYMLAAVALSRLELRGVLAWIWIGVVGAMTLLPWRLHKVASEEREAILPLVRDIAPGASLHAVYLDASTAALDPEYFNQFHAHDHFYGLVLGRAGFTDGLFPSTMTPVQYRAGLDLPFIRPDAHVPLLQLADAYRYLLIRGRDPRLEGPVRHLYRLVGRSGAWSLWESPRAPLRPPVQ